MGFFHHIRACNSHDMAGFRPFLVGETGVGWVRHDMARRLADWPRVFSCGADAVSLAPDLVDFETRSDAVAEVVAVLAAAGDVLPLRGEMFGVAGAPGEPPALQIDRAAATAFGIRAYGVHVNGFVRMPGDLLLWIARRAADRQVARGKLDGLVGGAQPIGLSVWETLLKEAREEASLTPDVAGRSRPVGMVSYTQEVPEGLKRDVLYLFDLELPEAVLPVNADGEITEFRRRPAMEVLQLVRETDAFKFNVNLVLIDFGLRHGLIGREEPDYIALCAGLRQ